MAIELPAKLGTLACLALGFTALNGCKRTFNDSGASAVTGSTSQMGPAALQLWDAYVSGVEGNATAKLQPDCKPKHYTLPPGVEYKGVIILYHGYTACPQQYFEWSERLASAGYEVLLPLLPGFGITPAPSTDPAWPEPVKDVIDFLPKLEELAANPLDPAKSKYAALATTMNAIAEAAKGEKLTGGLSVGGAVASHAINLKPDLYKRGILFAPFYAVGADSMRTVVDGLSLQKWLETNDPANVAKYVSLVSSNDLLKVYAFLQETKINDRILSLRHSWGPGCHKERKGGRAGICDFYLSNLSAVQVFGLKVMETTKPAKTLIQVVGVEDDKAASVDHIARQIGAWSGNVDAGKPAGGKSSAGGEVSACFYRSGAAHSLLSRFDNQDQDMFWIDDLLKDATEFVTAAKPFVPVAAMSLLPPFKRCRSR